MQENCRSHAGAASKMTKRLAASTARRMKPSAQLSALVVLITLVGFTFVASPAVHAGAATPRVPVILDTDIYSSADDVGAAATLFAYDLTGQDNVIALGVDTKYSRPSVATDSWECLAAIAQFYGYPNVPIGSDMPDNGPPPTTNNFIGPCAALASPTTPAPLPAVAVYRQALVSQPNDSVVIVCTGYEENLDQLLKSPADSISTLTGAQLIGEKVKELVVTGGGYPSSTGENNFEGYAGSANDVAQNWPTKIVYSGYEVGSNVVSGNTVTAVSPSNSPVRAAMIAFAGPNHAITSFDLTTAYHAMNPTDATYLTEVGPGTNSITSTGANTFTSGTGDEYYLALGDTTGLEGALNELWDTLPGTKAQTITFTSTPPASPTVGGGTYVVNTLGGATGNPVTLTIDPTSTSGCTIDTTGIVTFSPPIGSCIIDANEPGDTTYAAAAAQQTVQVQGIPQVISFTSPAPSSPVVGSTYTVSATGGASSNPVVFSIDSTSTSGCTISGSKVTFSAPRGICIVDANQLGTSTFAAASQVQQSIAVGGDPQTVSFSTTPPTVVRVGGATYTPAASASSGLGVSITLDPQSSGCSLSGGVVSFTAVGTCLIDATQAGTATFLPAEMQQGFAIAKGVSHITVVSVPKGAQAGGTYTPSARTNTGDPVHVTLGAHSTGCAVVGGKVMFRGVGACVVAFDDLGNANYSASVVDQPIRVAMGHVRLQTAVTPGSVPSGAVVSLKGTVSVGFATGTVTFRIQGKVVCAAALHGGVVSCRTPISLPKGSYKVVATYSGSGSFYTTTGATTLRLT
jgi:Big-like domain-containing protein